MLDETTGYFKLVDPSTDKGSLLIFETAVDVGTIKHEIELPFHYVTWNSARTFITFDNFKVITTEDGGLKVFYLDPA